MTTDSQLGGWIKLEDPPAVAVPNAKIVLSGYRVNDLGASYDLRFSIDTQPPYVIGDVLPFHHALDPDGKTLRIGLEKADGTIEYLNESSAEPPVLQELWAEFGTVDPEGSHGYEHDDRPLVPVRGTVEIRVNLPAVTPTAGITVDWAYGGVNSVSLRRSGPPGDGEIEGPVSNSNRS